MLKQIQLKFTKIKYSGDSVGDDIRIEVEALDKFLGLNMELDPKSERKFDEVIGDFFAEGSFFILPVNIKIIERDLIFNDVGETRAKLKVDLKKETPQKSVHKIEIHELRNFFSKKKAVFEVTVEAVVSDAIGYVKKTEDGWLKTKRADGKHISLPFCLKVRLNYIRSGREYCTILEGSWQGTDVSVVLDEQGNSRFFHDNPHTELAQLTYSISKKIVKFKNKTYQATDHPETPWEKGIYDVEIPDSPHGGGQNYPQSKYVKSWFLIGHDGARYLHLGTRSRGCMTVIEINKWDELYKNLITARKGDGKSIGIVKVID